MPETIAAAPPSATLADTAPSATGEHTYRTEASPALAPSATATAVPRDHRNGAGLVTSAIPSRPGATSGNSFLADGAQAPASALPKRTGHTFADVAECAAAAAVVAGVDMPAEGMPRTVKWAGAEGAHPLLEVAPGLVRVTWPDLAKREASANRRAEAPAMPELAEEEQAALQAALAEALERASEPVEPSETAEGADTPGEPAEPSESTRGAILGWSSRSRARMVATIAELDLAPLVAAGDVGMTTLTYPGEWESVAPNRAAVNRHLETLRKREARAWPQIEGRELWKFEFQRRGAPHVHRAHVIPEGRANEGEAAAHAARVAVWEAEGRKGPKPYRREAVAEGLPYREWLSVTWADIVGHADPEQRRRHVLAGTAVDMSEGERARDPKRLAVYFGKHGQFKAKDYQNEVPALWRETGESVGRFWGYRRLAKATVPASVSAGQAVFMGRVLARYAQQVRMINPVTGEKVTRLAVRREQRYRAEQVGTTAEGVPVIRYRKRWTTTRARRMTGKNRAGFLVVNDGPGMARDLARAAEVCLAEPKPAVGLRGPIWSRRELVDARHVEGPGQPAPATLAALPEQMKAETAELAASDRREPEQAALLSRREASARA